MFVSLPRRLESLLIAAFAGGVLALACGGGNEGAQSTPSSGRDGGTSTERRDAVPPGIELDTSLETTYYSVDGKTTESIFSHIENNGPTDGEGKRGSGLTSVVWGYEWQGGPETATCPACNSECSIRNMTVKAEMVVTLPKHVDELSLPPDIRANWEAYAESVAVHEQTHVDIYENGAGAIRARMLAIGAMSDCDELELQIKRIWDEEQANINQQQALFHQQEADRLAQQRTPIAAQIDANRATIDSLRNQISMLDAEIAGLRRDIDELILEINAIDQEIKAINDSNEPPADKQAKLVILVQQRNALQTRHNEAVDEHNGVLAQREPLANQRNALIDETNELVDVFNWTR